ncbi:MAG: hypothetical protein ACI9UN_000877 [Granulosicoccus sp.]|jgi:hypothetical protein
MTVSSHPHRLSNTLWCFFTARIHRLFAVSCRVVLICIVSGLIFVPQAMATNAIDRAHAIEIAKEQNGGGGKVLGVTTTTDSAGNTQFAVKLLSNGRVRVFTIKRAP